MAKASRAEVTPLLIPCYLSSRWQERGFTAEQAHAYYDPERASSQALQALESAGLLRLDGRRQWIRLPAFQCSHQPALSYQSPYQHIRLYHNQEISAVFLNETIQLEGQEEHYHNEMMVAVPLSVLEQPRRILILGGGFGMGAHLALQFDCLESIQLVEIDPDVVRLSQISRSFRKLNHKSLSQPRVHMHVGDAFEFLGQTDDLYDLIVFDCDITATRQSSELDTEFLLNFFLQIQSRLAPGGIFSTRIPIDDSYMEVVDQFAESLPGDDLERAARRVRQIWPQCHLLEFLSLYCGRELYIWNFAQESPKVRRRLAGGSPTYRKVLLDRFS